MTKLNKPTSNGQRLLRLTGALTAFCLAVLLLLGLITLLRAWTGMNATLPENWLVKLFMINAGVGGTKFADLYGVNWLDITIVALTGLTCLGVHTLLPGKRVWSLIGTILPFAGIMVFIFNGLAGRSSLMLAVLLVSVGMLAGKLHTPTAAWAGIAGGALLLVADFGTSETTQSIPVAACLAVGYLLLIIWCVLAGRKLLKAA